MSTPTTLMATPTPTATTGMTDERLRLAILVGSTREGRFGATVADWFTARARQRDDLLLDVIDLADHGTRTIVTGSPTAPDRRAFAGRIGAADAFAVVTPEYNHGYPAALKAAIDAVHAEWNAKPVGFVSYGGISGGLRSVEQLRQVFCELHAVPIRDTVSFHSAHSQFDGHGQPLDPERVAAAASTVLDQLVWWGRALREAREKRPFLT